MRDRGTVALGGDPSDQYALEDPARFSKRQEIKYSTTGSGRRCIELWLAGQKICAASLTFVDFLLVHDVPNLPGRLRELVAIRRHHAAEAKSA